MPAAVYALAVDQGATFRRTFLFERATGEQDESGQPEYEPFDFVGATLVANLSVGAALVLAIGDGITLGDPGQFSVEITDDQTASMISGRYDVVCTYPGGDVVRLLTGPVHVDRMVAV